jgi:hypothetical protein
MPPGKGPGGSRRPESSNSPPLLMIKTRAGGCPTHFGTGEKNPGRSASLLLEALSGLSPSRRLPEELGPQGPDLPRPPCFHKDVI